MQNKKHIKRYSIAPLFNKAALRFVLAWVSKQKYDSDKHVHKGWIEDIEFFAAGCPKWPRHMAESGFTSAYWKFPDLAAALLNELRQHWVKLEKTKPGKLKKFLADNSTVKWNNSFNSPEALAEWKHLAALCQVEEAKRPPVPRVGGRAPMIEDQQIEDVQRKIWSQRKHTGPGPDNMGNVPVWNLQDADIVIAFENSTGGFKVTKQQVREARRAVVADHNASETYAKKVLDKDGWLHIPAIKPSRRKQT